MTDQPNGKTRCSACGTENQSEYSFCKNCGNSLKQQGNPNHSYTAPSANPAFSYSPYGYQAADVKISGIATDTVAVAVGPNAHKYMPKFIEMELSRKKTGWNWAVFLLGFFFGLAAASCWFFYRKMYKVGSIVLVIGLVLTILSGVVASGFISNFQDIIVDFEDEYGLYYDYDQYEFDQDFEYFISDNPEYITRFMSPILISMLISFVNFVLVIVLSLFANGMYKDDIVKKINAVNMQYAGNVDHFQLARHCGTNTMAAVLSGIAVFLVSTFMVGYIFYEILDIAATMIDTL